MILFEQLGLYVQRQMAEAMGMSDNENASTLFFVMKTLTINLEEMASNLRATLAGSAKTQSPTYTDHESLNGSVLQNGDVLKGSSHSKKPCEDSHQLQSTHELQGYELYQSQAYENKCCASFQTIKNFTDCRDYNLSEPDEKKSSEQCCKDGDNPLESAAFQALSAQLELIEKGVTGRALELHCQLSGVKEDLHKQEFQLCRILELVAALPPLRKEDEQLSCSFQMQHQDRDRIITNVAPTKAITLQPNAEDNASQIALQQCQHATMSGSNYTLKNPVCTDSVTAEQGHKPFVMDKIRRLCARDLPTLQEHKKVTVNGGDGAGILSLEKHSVNDDDGSVLAAAGLPHYEEWKRLSAEVIASDGVESPTII